MVTIEKSEQGKLSIAGDASVFHVEELHAGLAGVEHPKDEPLVVDLSGVTAVDAAGVQTMLAFRRALGVERVTFEGLSDELRELLERLGLLLHLS